MVLRRECDPENRANDIAYTRAADSDWSSNGCEPVAPAAQTLNCYKPDNVDSAHRKLFRKSVLALTVSRSRSWALWALRFAKESYVWLVWIPLLLLGLGIGMNLLAVAMNHGTMPVVLPHLGMIGGNDKMHVAATANSRFLFLCDWIQLHATKRVVSPGDFLITAGDSLKWPLVWMWVGLSWGQATWRKLLVSSSDLLLTRLVP